MIIIIKDFTIIFIIAYLGEIISKYISFPMPGPVIGMIIFIFALQFKLINLKYVEKGSNIMLKSIAIFFIPPGVGIISSIHILHGNITKIIITMIISTILTMTVTGLTVQFLINRSKK